MQYLKQSTAATVKLGPFLDESTGKDTEEALTISQADIRLSKNGGAFAQTNNATGATHDENGWYGVPLDTTDTGTVGRLIVAVHESGALPVWREFMVVPANTYDSLVSGSDYLQADAVQIEGGDATDAINAACDTAVADYDGPTNAEMEARTLAAASYATAANQTNIEADTQDIQSRLPAALVGGRMDSDAVAISGSTTAADNVEANIGNLDAAITSLNDLSAAEVNAEVDTALTDIHLDHLLAADYDPASKPGVATALLNELVESDAGVSRFTANALEEAPTGGSAPTAGEIADAVWDEDIVAAHNTADTAGALLDDLGTPADFKADVSALAVEANVEGHVTTALNTYDPPTKAELDTAVADVSVDEIQASALADLFNTDSGTDYASAVSGSVVKEIADNAGGSALTEGGIADAVWDEAIADHLGAGSTGAALNGASAPTAADVADAVWDELSAGHTDAGKAGAQLWTDVDAILADTDELQTDDVPGLIGALNDVSAAEVNAEVDTALADYDPPTKAELDSGLAALNDPTAGDVADAVWDEAIADHQGAGSTGELLQDIDDEVDVIHDAILAMGLSGSAVGVLAESATITTGSQTNTYESSHAADETYHQVAEDGNEVDFYYQFDIGTDGVPVSVTAKGRVDEGSVPSGGDRVYIAAYDWAGAGWDTMGYGDGIYGSDPTDDLNMSFPLFAKHVGTGGNEGKVRIRFFGSSLEASTEVYIDQVFVQYANVLNYAGINAEVDTALSDYDPPTKAELDSGLAGLNDLTAAEVNAEVDTALADYDPPTKAELDTAQAAVQADIAALENVSAAEVNAEVVDALTVDVIADSVSADGSRPTIAQALLEINRYLQERSVSGTTVTVKKEDGSTSSMTFTLDDGSSPTSITRAS